MIKKIITKFLLVSLIATILISLHTAIYIIFFIEADLSFREIGLINLFYLLTLFVLGTPSEIIVNLLGKKFSLIVSAVLNGIALGFYSLAYNLLGFILAEIFFATGTILASNVLKIWLTDSLCLHKQEKEPKYTFYWKGKVISLIKLIVGFVGAYMGVKSLSLPFAVVSLGYWSLIISSLLIREEMHLRETKINKMTSIDSKMIAQESLAYVWQDDVMLIVIGFAIIIAIGFPFVSMIWHSRYYFFPSNNHLLICLWLLIGESFMLIRKMTRFCSVHIRYNWKMCFPGSCKIII